MSPSSEISESKSTESGHQCSCQIDLLIICCFRATICSIVTKVADKPILKEVEYLRSMGLPEAEIAVGVSAGRSTVRAWSAGTRAPTGERRDRVIELAAMVERLERVMEANYIPIWLSKPVPALGDMKPVELIGSGDYLRVAKVISGLEGQIAA